MKKEVEICDLCGIETAKIKCVLCKSHICKECSYHIIIAIKKDLINIHLYKPNFPININKGDIYICSECHKIIIETNKESNNNLIKGVLDILYKNALAEKL